MNIFGRVGRAGRRPGRAGVAVAAFVAVGSLLAGCGGESAAPAAGSGEVLVGILTKNNFNPYWVAIADAAREAAKQQGVTLIESVGKSDTDNSAQVTAIQNMLTRGVKTILITPADNKAIVPTLQRAREAGVQVITLDAATDPVDAADATFATNHTTMGKLIGEWAKAKFPAGDFRLAMLNCDPAAAPCIQRHDGFLEGLGIAAGDPRISGQATTEATISTGVEGMETLLQKDPSINLVYTVSEPVGTGAAQALQKAGRTDVTVVTIDGSCQGVGAVGAGTFAANSQQYPQVMAQKGIEAAVQFAKTGQKASGFLDTGEKLVAATPLAGVTAMTPTEGAADCWGQNS